MGIYRYERSLELAEQKVRNAEYHEKTKEVIFDFETQLFLEGLSVGRVIKYMSHIQMYANWLGDSSLADVEIADIKRFVGWLERSGRRPSTKMSYKAFLRKLYRWLEKPELVDWIVIKAPHGEKKIPEELLTEDEIKQMIEVANHPRDKAIVAALYDSGCRISEMANLQIKHIKFDQYGAVITVDGKTGMRRVRLISSVPYLSAWLAIHPDRNNPDAYLWINRHTRNTGGQLQYSGYRLIIVGLAKKAGIKKRVHNHLFRHSRSTELAQHLTQAQMEDHLGWVHGSNMPSVYIHMSGKQVDDALLRMHGIVKEEDTRPKLTVVQCPRCDQVNGTTAKFCSRCGMALSLETALDTDRDEFSLVKKYAELRSQYPEVFDEIENINTR